jgi:hypothetical protein
VQLVANKYILTYVYCTKMYNVKLEKYIERNTERREERKLKGRKERRNKEHKKSHWCLIISVKRNKYMYRQKLCVGRNRNCPDTELVLHFYATSKCDESETRRRNFGRSAVLSYLWFRTAGSLGMQNPNLCHNVHSMMHDYRNMQLTYLTSPLFRG